ncbi:hypothetical protein BC835DRAFT_1304911 [Cytidiella melzeri]|nr:hypothetical protein BC835DRAFT_1304911 [Cytidiella melzeri]
MTKMDLRTGALLAKPAIGKPGGYVAVSRIGPTLLDDIKAQGFTGVHPVPSFDDLTALAAECMQELGLSLMYDMTYKNLTAVMAPQNALNNNLQRVRFICSLNGHHSVSLVLNCEDDLYFTDYTSGADIVTQHTYIIGNNSRSVCTPDYGCDNCKEVFEDISTRMDSFTYSKREPTGIEYIVAVLGVNHGGLGVLAWNDPSTPDIQASTSSLAKALPTTKECILSHVLACDDG